MGIQELVNQATALAVNTLKSDATLFFVTSEKSTKRLYFDGIDKGVDAMIEDSEDGQIRTKETGWLVSRETFRKLSAFCHSDFTGCCVIRISNGRREVWKLLDEEPWTELIENGVFYRLNAYLIRTKKT